MALRTFDTIRPTARQCHRHAEADQDRRRDIGYFAPAYTRHEAVSEVAIACRGRSRVPARHPPPTGSWRGTVVSRTGYTANNIRLLLAVSLPQYRIFTIKNPWLEYRRLPGP